MSKSSRNKEKPVHVANAKILYLRLFRYAWAHKAFFLITIISTAILAASNTGFLALIKQVTDEGFVKQSADKAMILPLMLFALMSLRGLAGFVSMYSMRVVARRIVAKLRAEAFNKFMQLPVSYFDASTTGVLVSKLTYDAERLARMYTLSAECVAGYPHCYRPCGLYALS